MGQRRRARELAVQLLYQLETSPEDLSSAMDRFELAFGLPAKAAEFYGRLVKGVSDHRAEIDQLIERFSKNWKLERMSKVDRNILRLAVFELIGCPDVPDKVVINEAVDLGKRFGTGESGAFINGVLDAIKNHLEEEAAACVS